MKLNSLTCRLAAVIGLASVSPLIAAESALPAVDAEALQRWQAMRFGLFVHWGPVSLKGTEIGWSRGDQVPAAEYDGLYRAFNPTQFDANRWAQVAREAGMKYLVFTSKHHDGFCMWDSQFTDYDIMSTPFRRDVVRELADACRREGLLFCLYHSICDWRHPDYPLGSPGGKSRKPSPDMNRYNAYLKNQLGELIRNYGPLGILWFDGEWEEPWDEARANDLYRFCRAQQPSLLINNRVGKARNDMAGTSKAGLFSGDYDTPEQQIGRFNLDRPWESCITICQQWAWKPDDRMKSLQECLQTLITCAGGDGNLLFNVGPMPDGRIEPRQVDRLKEMGAWLAKHGESIYGTRGGPFKPGKWGASTRRGDTVFVHAFQWPAEGDLTLPAIARKVVSSRVLTGGRVAVQQSAAGLTLRVPAADRQPIDTLIELKLDGPALDLPPLTVGRRSLAEGRPATASNTYQGLPAHAPGMALDGDEATRWATDSGTRSAWLAVDLGSPTTFSGALIEEWNGDPGRIRAYEVQVLDGPAWKTVHAGKTVSPAAEVRFQPVTARQVRLNILDARDGPTISEFAVLP